MSLPGDHNSVEEKGNDEAFVLQVLESLCAQQDEHVELIEQVACYQEYWDLQQKWNFFGQKNKLLKEKNQEVRMKHEKEEEELRVQRLMMQHHFEVQEKQMKSKNDTELARVQQELADHRKEWNVVVQELNTCKASMHPQWSGRLVMEERQKQECDQNKVVLQNVVQQLRWRMEQAKQVATGTKAEGAAPALAGPGISVGGEAPAIGRPGISPALAGPGISVGGAAYDTGVAEIAGGGGKGTGQARRCIADGGESRVANRGHKRNRVSMDPTGDVGDAA